MLAKAGASVANRALLSSGLDAVSAYPFPEFDASHNRWDEHFGLRDSHVRRDIW